MIELNKKTLTRIFFLIAGCIVLYWLLHEAERVQQVTGKILGVISPFVIGSGIAFILNVPMRFIENKLTKINNGSLRRSVALVITFILLALVLAVVFWLLIPQIVDTVQSLIPQLYDFFLEVETFVEQTLKQNPELFQWINSNTDFQSFDWTSAVQKVLSVLGQSVSSVLMTTVSAIGSVTTVIFNFVISLVFAIYCLFQKETLARQGRKVAYAFLSENKADYIVRVLRLSNSTFSNFLSGQCIEVCILGGMFAIAMAIFRMPYIPLISVLIAVTAFIPIVGAWIGCVVGTFLILVVDPMQAVWFVVLFLVIQQIEGNMIYPKVVGTSIGLSGMWVLVAIAVGGKLMGVAGMFLMIPFASVLYALFKELTNKRLSALSIAPEKLKDQPPELKSNFKQIRETNRKNRLLRRQLRMFSRKKENVDTSEEE